MGIMNRRVIVVGPSGCGKTTQAEAIAADMPNAVVVDEWNPQSVMAGSWVVCTQSLRSIPRYVQESADVIYQFAGVDEKRGRMWELVTKN